MTVLYPIATQDLKRGMEGEGSFGKGDHQKIEAANGKGDYHDDEPKRIPGAELQGYGGGLRFYGARRNP
jgi:hypothetical protein